MVLDLKSWSSQQVRNLSDGGARPVPRVYPTGSVVQGTGLRVNDSVSMRRGAPTTITKSNPPVVRTTVVRKVVKGVSSPTESYPKPSGVYTPSSNNTTTISSSVYRASQSPPRGGWNPKYSNAAPPPSFTVMGSSISNFPPVSPVLPGRDCLSYMASKGGSHNRIGGYTKSTSTVHMAPRQTPLVHIEKPGLPKYEVPEDEGNSKGRPPAIRVVRSHTGERSSSASPLNEVELESGASSVVGDRDYEEHARSADVTRIGVSEDSSTSRGDSAMKNESQIGDDDGGVDGEPLDDGEEMEIEEEEEVCKETPEMSNCSALSPVRESEGSRNSMEVPVAIALRWLLSTEKAELEKWTFDLTDVGLRNVLEVVASHVRSKGCHLEEVQKEIKNARGCDAFAFFGLDEKCDIADLKKAYKEKSRELHPDKGGDEEAFVDMKAKYEDILQSADGSDDVEESKEKGSIGWDPAKRETMVKALFELRHQVILIEQKIDNLEEELKRVQVKKASACSKTKHMLPSVEESMAS